MSSPRVSAVTHVSICKPTRPCSISRVFNILACGCASAFLLYMKRSKLTQATCLVLWLLASSAKLLYGAGTHDPARRIVISIPQKQLTLFEGDSIVKTYDVAVGKPSTPSPVGSWEVVNRIDRPTWYAHGKPVAPGPSNPLGTRWIGLSKSGYGIHGTNEPDSIGKAVSHGCIRMRNKDVEELFALVEPGMKVELTDF